MKVINKSGPFDLTNEILNAFSVNEIIYAEYADSGAMGVAGGILIYTMKEDILFCYKTSIFIDQITYENAINIFKNNSVINLNTGQQNENGVFNFYNGGCGNHVFINKDKKLKPFDGYFLFLHNGRNYRIYSSVNGVFIGVVYQLQMKNKPKRKRKLKN